MPPLVSEASSEKIAQPEGGEKKKICLDPGYIRAFALKMATSRKEKGIFTIQGKGIVLYLF